MNRAQRRAEEKQPVSQTTCSQQEATQEHIPLRSGETTELQLLWACREVLDTAGQMLEKRLKAAKRWRQYRTMQKWIANITEDLMNRRRPPRFW